MPTERLDIPGEPDPHHHVRAVTAALLPLLRDPPDLLVVQGDTSSALGAALASSTAGVPVAHVEAGLRTHDPELPWPEEEYRIAIDARAELLFAPTSLAAANLRAEQVSGEVHVTGNTAIDAVLRAAEGLTRRQSGRRRPRLLVTCHRRESWRDGLSSIATAIRQLTSDGAVQAEVLLHPNTHVASAIRSLLGDCAGVRLIDPCNQRELLELMIAADLVLSDSGGIQEEAPALGVPLLVLRDKTERPEGIAAGCALLVGTTSERIIAEARRLLGDPAALTMMSRRCFPYGDGRAAPRIAAIVSDWIERQRGRLSSRLGSSDRWRTG